MAVTGPDGKPAKIGELIERDWNVAFYGGRPPRVNPHTYSRAGATRVAVAILVSHVKREIGRRSRPSTRSAVGCTSPTSAT